MKLKNITFFAIILISLFGCKSQRAVSQSQPIEKVYYVQIETDYGNMLVKLYNETPLHRDNFLKLVGKGVYDGLLFHRVINHFMIQGGDPDSKTAKPGQFLGEGTLDYRIPAEFVPGLFHKKGVLAAARDDNPEKASSACQFYLVQGQVWDDENLKKLTERFNLTLTPEQIEVYKTLGGSPHLDGSYTVFGEVVEGVDVLDKIAAVPTDRSARPKEDVRMKMSIVEVK